MKKFALTGGIACGKSLASEFLKELGVEILDADDIVHEIIPDPAERRRIAAEVFSDPIKRRELESRIHPLVRSRIHAWLEEARPEAAPLRVAVIPLLYETGWEKDFDFVGCIVSSRELQIARMMGSRSYSKQEAVSRIEAQMPTEEKASRADFVIENDGSKDNLRRQLAAFAHELRGNSLRRGQYGIIHNMKDLKEAYKTIEADHFAPKMEISFIDGANRQTFHYEKVTWNIDGEEKGLRYGENPGQEAALYKLVNGNLVLGDVEMLQPGRYLASVPELLQSGKHPGKTNVTDTDNALNILRYLMEKPCAVIVKHNNPCGVATGSTLAEAYFRANKADRLAAFGGAIALNRECDMETAKLIIENYAEVVVAPDFKEGVMDLFAAKKNLRVFRIKNMERLADFVAKHVVDFKSLIDGGIVAQTSFSANARKSEDMMPAYCNRKITDKATGAVTFEEHKIKRLPTAKEYEDLVFGWLVEAGVTSNSVLYVKDGATVGIGTGEQDRVGVAEIARDKAYTKHADWIAWEKYQKPYNDLRLVFGEEDGAKKQAEIMEQTCAEKGGIPGCAMVSDAFFPFRDGAEVGIREGITSIVQPGGAIRDWDVIDCCNDAGVAMVFTGQRSFRH